MDLVEAIDVGISTDDDADDNDDEFDEKGHEEKEKMLGHDQKRRNSDPGVIPTPMSSANIFSKYVSFW
jgi:hypothetical protein